ncbi:MAG: AMP phosphorylase [archaeon]
MKKLKTKLLDIEAGKPIVLLNREDATDMSLHIADRVRVGVRGKTQTAIVDISDKFIKPGEVGIFDEIEKRLGLKRGNIVEVRVADRPESIDYIRKKMDGMKLTELELLSIIQDIVDDNLSSVEISAFVAASYIRGYDMDETAAMTRAMVATGKQIDFGDHVVDKHCIGGVAGNRTTMLVVPIVAAAGLTIPKTSSRAITSAAGTADTMEVLANVEFKVNKIREIVKKTGGCIVWSGAVNLAPADDKIIRVRYPMLLDPEGQLLASIMAKKKSIGSDYVVIDIPVGKGAKISNKKDGNALAKKFIDLGKRIGIKVECLVTDGSEPIGRGIGPGLEARDVLLCLNNEGPQDLSEKACELAGVLFELSGKSKRGQGKKRAQRLLESGKAKKKMMEIIKAQGGNPKVTPEDIKIGKYTQVVIAAQNGNVHHIDNKLLSKVARAAGAPKDHQAGIYLHTSLGKTIEAGMPLFTIYARDKEKLKDAVELTKRYNPVQVGGLTLEALE